MEKKNPLFEQYLKLLLKWNRSYNLTAITDKEEIRIKHFEDSLAVTPFLPRRSSGGAKAGRLLDIGTGAGFPGIPLKIARSDLEIVLLDSVQKKIAFCEAAIRELGLKRIEAMHGRAEDPKVQSRLGLFDIVISRATFSIVDFLPLAEKYLRPGGAAIAMKGRNWEEDLSPLLGWVLEKTFDYELSGSLGKRSLLIFKRKLIIVRNRRNRSQSNR